MKMAPARQQALSPVPREMLVPQANVLTLGNEPHSHNVSCDMRGAVGQAGPSPLELQHPCGSHECELEPHCFFRVSGRR